MQTEEIQKLEEDIRAENPFIETFFTGIEKVIVGQRHLLDRLLVGLLANGHMLIEGVPGLAKTMAVKAFSQMMQTKFQRIQFTPDMLPADLIGTPIYNQATGKFSIKKGPIFTNIILADEINRAPAKVQSALLEVMQEKQITIGEQTFPIEQPFLVLATQNPIEQDGTYQLPESQLDRFMLNIKLSYPSREEEARILKRMSFTDHQLDVERVLDPQHILRIRALINKIYIDEKVENYILDIVSATRSPEKFGLDELKPLIQFGVSPRAAIHLSVAAKAHAFIEGRGYVRPQDIKSIAHDVLQHRIIVTMQAAANGLAGEDVLQQILDAIVMP